MLTLPFKTQCGKLACDGGGGEDSEGLSAVKPLRMRPAEKREDSKEVDRRIGFVFLLLP